MSDELDLDDWLATGTVARVDVPIYNDPAVAAEAEALRVERAEIEAALKDDSGEKSLTDTDPFADIDARIEAVSELFEASLSTWTMGAVSGDEWDAIEDAHPREPQPTKPPVGAPAPVAKKYLEDFREWQKRDKERRLTVDIATVAASVLSVTQGDKTTTSVTAEHVRRLRSRPGGIPQFNRLLDAAIQATKGEVAPPLPK
ncbi:hypothetical protein [Demequina globuliformis]|uniref:hypothetical protein n=1 Tax=Demequina globuliformis TaxID=676202 RepID=UPI000780E265|nr:hypothetical protein [Demequina globuliformis]